MRFVLDFDPKGKVRHRCRKNSPIPYYPSDAKRHETEIKMAIKTQMAQKSILKLSKQPLMASLYFGIPKGRSCSRSAYMQSMGYPCIKKPDVDNAAKLYLDAMNKLVYDDDACITHLWAEKYNSEQGHVIIDLMSIPQTYEKQHLLSFKDDISESDLQILLKKGYQLGLARISLHKAFLEQDSKGKKHLFVMVGGNNLPPKGLC